MIRPRRGRRAVRSAASSAPVPEPRRPPDTEHQPSAPSGPRPREDTVVVPLTAAELPRVLSELAEVAVRISGEGEWGEYDTFLLRTHDDRWHAAGLADPMANLLVSELATLPGFDANLLLTLISERTRQIVTLWHAPVPGKR